MTHIRRTLAATAVLFAAIAGGCSSHAVTGENEDSDHLTVSRGEHGQEGGEHDRDGHGQHGEEGEESGTKFALDESYDEIRHGARLILAYDAESNSFQGTVENTTDQTLKQVRVEVHLSNGRELGPTTPGDLQPGQIREVKLTAIGKDFDAFSAHPEVGIGEHGHGEGDGEHDRAGAEHDGKARS